MNKDLARTFVIQHAIVRLFSTEMCEWQGTAGIVTVFCLRKLTTELEADVCGILSCFQQLLLDIHPSSNALNAGYELIVEVMMKSI